MRDLDRHKQQTLSRHLNDQIQYKRSSLLLSRQEQSRPKNDTPYDEFKNQPVALASGGLVTKNPNYEPQKSTPFKIDAIAEKFKARLERMQEQKMQTERLRE